MKDNQDDHFYDEAFEEFDSKSKTQVKKEFLAITSLGQKLIEQPVSILSKLPLSENILNAITQAKTMKRIALKRQIGYIGKLLRNSNIDEIKSAFQKIEDEQKLGNALFHRIESLRDGLISDQSKGTLESFFNQYPNADRQQIRQLVKKAKDEVTNNKPTKRAYRELFQTIKFYIDNASE